MGYGSGMGVDGVEDVVVMSDVVDDDGALIGGRGWLLDEWCGKREIEMDDNLQRGTVDG
jgi:hypothetical protein